MDPERNLLYCPACNSKYDVSGVASGKRFVCKTCSILVQIPPELGKEPFFKVSESKEVLKPELILDETAGRPAAGENLRFSFTKMAATENDYILLDCYRGQIPDPSKLAQVACHRRRGIGSDGVLLFGPSQKADFRMRMFNPDGSEAEMCGNGIRCLARYARDHGYAAKPEFTIETGAGVKSVSILDRGGALYVRVDMGTVKVEAPKGKTVRIEAAGRAFEGVPVSVGNPHFVVFAPDTNAVELEKYGPAIEHHQFFPNRTNVEFVQVLNPEEVIQRTHERGAGETNGCGTGATAVCGAGVSLGLTKPKIVLHLKGGDLEVEIGAGGRASLTGPAVEVFSGSWPSGASGTGSGQV